MAEQWESRGTDGKSWVKEWKIPTLELDGELYYGPMSNFANITWQEFIYADQCMMHGLHLAMMAALYRPKRPDYNGETDTRIPFSTYGTTHRFEAFKNIPGNMKLAILINYRAMRAAALEEVYTYIFPYHDEKSTQNDDLPDDTPPEPDIAEKHPFSWTNIHRNLIGDNIQDEDKYLQLPVHTVLFRLNQLIEESRKNRKKI